MCFDPHALYSPLMTPADIRRWVQAHRAAEERERDELRRHPTSSAEAIQSALALVALTGRLHGWPPPEDDYTRREHFARIRCWDRLRTALI